ncbi:cysteine hydrolase family protein [Candidatus Woesearchaeota archaeon]|nr:cysteine hydrolase family protein [Candidatus Woesearchaeota archaeon]
MLSEERATELNRILKPPKPEMGVLVIDMQDNLLLPSIGRAAPIPPKTRDQIVSAQTEVLYWAQRYNIPVAYTKMAFSGTFNRNGIYRPIKEMLDALPKDRCRGFPKENPNALESKALQDWSDEQGINKYFVMGIKASECVFATMRGGVGRISRTTPRRYTMLTAFNAIGDEAGKEGKGREMIEQSGMFGHYPSHLDLITDPTMLFPRIG